MLRARRPNADPSTAHDVTTTHEAESFGQVLRRYRVAAGLSQEALAERAGLSLRGVSDLERGLSRAPRLHTLGRLMDALGLEGSARQTLASAGGSPAVDVPEPVDIATARRAVPQPLPGYLRLCSAAIEMQPPSADLLRQPDIRLLTLTGPAASARPGWRCRSRRVLAMRIPMPWCLSRWRRCATPPWCRRRSRTPRASARAADVPLLDSLAAAWRGQRVLLVLDNYEHVLDAAPLVGDLLRRCPELTILATSRTRLRVHGERNYPVKPLLVPESGAAEAWTPAVALFVERAQAAQPDFSLTPENARAVVADLPSTGRSATGARACRGACRGAAAGGNPGASTAAAPDPDRRRCATRPSATRRYGTRSPGATTCSVRSEQRVFRTLSVFAGGWTLAAAEEVCAEPRGRSPGSTRHAGGAQSVAAHGGRDRRAALRDAGDDSHARAGSARGCWRGERRAAAPRSVVLAIGRGDRAAHRERRSGVVAASARPGV